MVYNLDKLDNKCTKFELQILSYSWDRWGGGGFAQPLSPWYQVWVPNTLGLRGLKRESLFKLLGIILQFLESKPIMLYSLPLPFQKRKHPNKTPK